MTRHTNTIEPGRTLAIDDIQDPIIRKAISNPRLITRELNNRSLFNFLQWAWPEISGQPFVENWHIRYLAKELEKIAYRVGNREKKEYDLIINVPPGSTKPVWEEEEVLMANGTYKKLKEIVQGDEIINMYGNSTIVDQVHIQGKQSMVNIETYGGRSVYMALDHPVLTTKGWVNAGDIQIGDVLALRHNPRIKSINTRKDVEFRIAGYLIGDGSVSSNNCSVCGVNMEYIDDFISCVKEMGFDYYKFVDRNGVTVVNLKAAKNEKVNNKGKYKGMGRGFRIVEGPRQWTKEIGIRGLTSKTKKVPDFVWNGTDEQIAMFIATYFQCDGTAYYSHKSPKKNIKISFTTISFELAKGIQRLLLRLGVQMNIRKRINQSGFTFNRNIKDYVSYEVVTCDQQAVSMFFEKIPIKGYKLRTIQNFKPQKRLFSQEYLSDEVKVVKRVRSLPCRCLSVREGHSFVVDGIVVHNTILCSIVFPVWCWTKWYWMRFITASYSSALSLESAEYSRDLVKSARFKEIYPDIDIKADKDTKGNFKIVKTIKSAVNDSFNRELVGGNRFSTSVGGTLTGYHADIAIWDDPINPQQSFSDNQIEIANRWIDQTLPTRKTNKEVSTIIGIMQRLHQDDPTGHILEKKKVNVKHICLPGEIRHYKNRLSPPELAKYYVNDLFDINRMNWEVLRDLEMDLGQYGYAGQIGQSPTPAGGGMFKIDHLQMTGELYAKKDYVKTVRYWDKAGVEGGKGAFTCGVKMSRMKSGLFLIDDIKRGRWSTERRERIIRQTAEADGDNVFVVIEQEGGSGGKESAESTVRNLAGFHVEVDHPTGDKAKRADPYSVQVNNGNVILRVAEWNREYKEELSMFPNSTYKDQVDASSGAFNYLVRKKDVRRIT